VTTRSSRGRRPGSPDTRSAILVAARGLFAERGFSGTSIRAIGAAAEVDPALVHHYFGIKDDLFIAALALPVDPRVALRPVIEGGPEDAGERLLQAFLSVWDNDENRLPLLGIVRGAFDPQGQRLVRDGVLQMVLGPVGIGLGIDRPEHRMPLVASQLIGLVMTRYVVRMEPVASMPADLVVATYAPTIQRYLTGELPA